MAAEQAIVARLIATSGFTDLVGLSPTRLYPVKKDAGDKPKLPYVIYSRFPGAGPIRSMGGGASKESDFIFDIYASSFTVVQSVATQVEAALDWFSGASGGTTVLHTELEGTSDIDLDEQGVFLRVMDFRVVTVE